MRESMRERFARVLPRSAGTEEPKSDADTAAIAAILGAIHGRGSAGQTTTLRQLHTAAGLGQPDALKLIDRLEKNGLVEVKLALHDEFESKITLTDAAKRKLAQLAR